MVVFMGYVSLREGKGVLKGTNMINKLISGVVYRLTSHKETFCGCSRSCYFFLKYPPGNDHTSPFKGTFEDDVPFPQMGYVSIVDGKCLNKRNITMNLRCLVLFLCEFKYSRYSLNNINFPEILPRSYRRARSS